MKNLLLVFLNELENIEELNQVLENFDEESHTMEVINDIGNDESFNISSLPNIVNYFKREHQNIDRVIVLSNARDLLFCWYRCYNSLVDDFVYFIDADDKNYFSENIRHYDFYKSLYRFDNIESEGLKGKIYFNINFNNYDRFIKCLLENNMFRYFGSLDSFDRKTEKNKKSNKIYKYNNNIYEFNLKEAEEKEQVNLIERKEEIELDNKFIKEVINNIYIVPYIVILFFRAKDQELTNILLSLFKQIRNLDGSLKKQIFEKLIKYIDSDKQEFREKVYVSSLLASMRYEDERLAEFIMKTLLEDNENFEYHYGVLYNTLFYTSNDNMIIKGEVYKYKREEIIKLGNYIKENYKIDIEKNRGYDTDFENLKIAIHYDQLLDMNHSPTRMALDLAKNFKRYYPKFKIKIFVEDNLIINSKELMVPYAYSSRESHKCKKIHKEYLEGFEVDIYYSNIRNTKFTRTKDIVEEIDKFKPDVIYTTSDLSLAREILYDHYPIIYRSHGGYNFSTLADKYIYQDEICINVNRINEKLKMIDESKMIDIGSAVELIEPRSIINREEYSIGDDDFILVTVGNRLDVEITDSFADIICSFIERNKNIYWLIIGGKKIPYLIQKYSKLIQTRKIIFKNYENDLSALYRMCNIYVNPIRKGGGMSIGLAMNQSLPVIVTQNSQDGSIWLGKENCIGVSREEYIQELNKLYKDKKYYNTKKKEMKLRIEKFGYKEYIDKLIKEIAELRE